MRRAAVLVCAALLVSGVVCSSFAPMAGSNETLPDLYEASIMELQDGLDKGLFTSVDLVKVYLAFDFPHHAPISVNGWY